jgi:hypothetical protein
MKINSVLDYANQLHNLKEFQSIKTLHSSTKPLLLNDKTKKPPAKKCKNTE